MFKCVIGDVIVPEQDFTDQRSGRCSQNGHKRTLAPETFFISRKVIGHDKSLAGALIPNVKDWRYQTFFRIDSTPVST
ncbi:hypothetical protein [Xanthocytophaga agilis]|uniref:Uncharacterized protein n=1 Tax=Xanthocytophaga agilis TaxID=3048010 RepID=A0AAE3RBR8_9BACT|nr:hypothetical protein [Xanthocytophaga agilis]MDJ1505407.1 hypothetical protein [Xanthocytophaga agilis]